MNLWAVLSRKLERADAAADRLVGLAKLRSADFVGDGLKVDAAERGLQVCIESMLDGCELVLQSTGARVGPYARATVRRAASAGLLKADEVRSLTKLIDIRNRLVHDYERVDPVTVYRHLLPTVALFRRLARRFRRMATGKSEEV